MQMILVWVLRLIFIFLFVKWSPADACCKGQLRKKDVIPNFAKDVKSTDLKVVFAGKSIECGSTVDVLRALNPPTLYFNLPRQCKFATVITFSPYTYVQSPFLNWLVINIPRNNLRKGFTTPPGLKNTKKNGYIVSDYVNPKDPTGGTGIRKEDIVVYFVYCQRSFNSDRSQIALLSKGYFNATDYAKKNKLGDPIAGLFYVFSATGLTLPSLVTLPETHII